MCEGCWHDYGSPTLDTPLVRAAAALIRKLRARHDGFVTGALHCFIEDWNLESEFLRADESTSEADAYYMAAFAILSIDERASALARADGII